MTRSEVIAQLRREGFAASVGRIRHALRFGYLKPMPGKAARGAHHFTARHLEQLRWYFVNIRPGPQPLYAETLPIGGPQDRLHRLARKKQQLRERGPSERALRRQRRRETDAAIEALERIAGELAH